MLSDITGFSAEVSFVDPATLLTDRLDRFRQ